jgi:hypothetical protein
MHGLCSLDDPGAEHLTELIHAYGCLHPGSLVLKHEELVHGRYRLLIRVLHAKVLLAQELSVDIKEVQILVGGVLEVEAADLVFEAEEIRELVSRLVQVVAMLCGLLLQLIRDLGELFLQICNQLLEISLLVFDLCSDLSNGAWLQLGPLPVLPDGVYVLFDPVNRPDQLLLKPLPLASQIVSLSEDIRHLKHRALVQT